MNLSLVFLIRAPGRRPISVRIWNPLQTPRTAAPFAARSARARITGALAAIAPALR